MTGDAVQTRQQYATVRQAELEALCGEVFYNGEELRRWARRNLPGDFVRKLPNEIVSDEVLIDSFVQLVDRLGYWDIVAPQLRQLRGGRRHEGRVHQPYPDKRPAWQRRYDIGRTVTIALTLLFAVTRGYPALDFSRAARRAESSLFAFLPISYRDRALIGLLIVSLLFTLTCRFMSRRTRSHR